MAKKPTKKTMRRHQADRISGGVTKIRMKAAQKRVDTVVGRTKKK